MPSILPLAGIFTLVALALGLVYWNIYSNSASTMTTRNNMSVAVRNCRTSCCKEQKYTALAKYIASNSSSPKRCYKKISLSIFGENVFSFQPLSDDTSCDHIMRRGVDDASCQSSYYNMSRRATECAQTSKCTSDLSRCLHHICAAGVLEYYEDLHGVRQHLRDGHTILAEILRVPGSHDLLTSIMAKGRMHSSLTTKEFLKNALKLAYEEQHGGFPMTSNYSARSLLVGSWIACGMSSSATIPFFDNIGPLTDSVRRWRTPPSDLSNKPHERLVVATFATTHASGLDILIESSGLMSIKLTVLGYGEVQADAASKLTRMLEFLRTLHSDTVLLFLDGFDTMLVKGEEYILAAYQSLEKDIVFAAEGYCFPYHYYQYNLGVDLCNLYYPKIQNGTKKLRFLNSGTYIGYAGALLSLLSDLETLVGLDYAESYPGADQNPMGQMLMSGRWDIGLDYNGKIFIDCHSYSDEEVKESEAAVLHFQGQKARDMSLATEYFLPRMCSKNRNL